MATASTAEAFVHYLINIAETSRTASKSDFAVDWLSKLALKGVGFLNQWGGGHLYLTDHASLSLSGSGTCNLNLVENHEQANAALRGTWNQCGLQSNFDSASLIDVTRFVAVCRRKRRSMNQRAFSRRSDQAVVKLCVGVVKLLSAILNTYVRHVLQTTPGIDERQIPSRKKKTKRQREALVVAEGDQTHAPRSHCKLDVDAIWELIRESQDTGVSLPILARTKRKEKQGGCSEHTVRHWMNKLHAMYCHRASLSFRDV